VRRPSPKAWGEGVESLFGANKGFSAAVAKMSSHQ